MDLEPYQYTGANFTGVRILNPDEQEPELIFDHELAEMGLEDLSKLPLEAALMFDAVYIFARAFKRFKDAVKGDARTLDCTALDSWEHGTSLSNFIRDVSFLFLLFKIQQISFFLTVILFGINMLTLYIYLLFRLK